MCYTNFDCSVFYSWAILLWKLSNKDFMRLKLMVELCKKLQINTSVCFELLWNSRKLWGSKVVECINDLEYRDSAWLEGFLGSKFAISTRLFVLCLPQVCKSFILTFNWTLQLLQSLKAAVNLFESFQQLFHYSYEISINKAFERFSINCNELNFS